MPGQPAALLLLAAEVLDRRPDRGVGEVAVGHPPVLHLLDEQELVEQVAPLPALLDGPAHARPALLLERGAEARELGPAGAVGGGVLGEQLGRAPLADECAQLGDERAVLGFPLEIHRGPSGRARPLWQNAPPHVRAIRAAPRSSPRRARDDRPPRTRELARSADAARARRGVGADRGRRRDPLRRAHGRGRSRVLQRHGHAHDDRRLAARSRAASGSTRPTSRACARSPPRAWPASTSARRSCAP